MSLPGPGTVRTKETSKRDQGMRNRKKTQELKRRQNYENPKQGSSGASAKRYIQLKGWTYHDVIRLLNISSDIEEGVGGMFGAPQKTQMLSNDHVTEHYEILTGQWQIAVHMVASNNTGLCGHLRHSLSFQLSPYKYEGIHNKTHQQQDSCETRESITTNQRK
jgi:hypothetical protein